MPNAFKPIRLFTKEEMLKLQGRAKRNEFLSIAEVCALLKITRQTFHNWRSHGLKPEIASPVRIKLSTILAWWETRNRL